MPLETIAIIVIAGIVLLMFGRGVRKRRKRDGDGTRIIIVNNEEDVRIDDRSGGAKRSVGGFAKFLTLLVSIGIGFFAAGFVITTFVEPELGYVDPVSPVAVVLYGVFGIIIYGLLRLLIVR